jgi:hypothetical protein
MLRGWKNMPRPWGEGELLKPYPHRMAVLRPELVRFTGDSKWEITSKQRSKGEEIPESCRRRHSELGHEGARFWSKWTRNSAKG